MDTHDYAYMAGFFDGEGYIGVTVQKAKKPSGEYASVCLYVRIEQTRLEALSLFHKYFSGRIMYRPPKNERCQAIYVYDTTRKGARVLLQALLPYLLQNKERAELALKVLSIKGHELAEAKWGYAARLAEINLKGQLNDSSPVIQYYKRNFADVPEEEKEKRLEEFKERYKNRTKSAIAARHLKRVE